MSNLKNSVFRRKSENLLFILIIFLNDILKGLILILGVEYYLDTSTRVKYYLDTSTRVEYYLDTGTRVEYYLDTSTRVEYYLDTSTMGRILQNIT